MKLSIISNLGAKSNFQLHTDYLFFIQSNHCAELKSNS